MSATRHPSSHADVAAETVSADAPSQPVVRPAQVTLSAVKRVSFGTPAAERVQAQLDEWGSERVLILASTSLNRGTDEVDALARACGQRVVGVKDGIPEHTPLTSVLEVTEEALRTDAEVLVTVGGGTLTDLGKAVRMCLSAGVTHRDQVAGVTAPRPASPEFSPKVRQISVPTTLSAAEFTGIAGVTDEASRTKELWRSPEIAPDSVILDPWLTRHTPEWLFLSTGMRAIDHAVEGYCAPDANTYTDALTVRGLRLLYFGLREVRADAADIEARLSCQVGAWMAMSGLGSGVPMGASHGIGYVLGATHGIPHGYTSCVVLPAVLDWNAAVNGHRQAQLVQESGIGPGALPTLVRDLVEQLGLPRTLDAVGIDAGADDEIAQRSLETAWLPFNPRPVQDAEDVAEILALAR